MTPLAHIRVEHVVFDLGGVVLAGPARLPEIARRIGAPADVTPEDFRNAYNAPRLAYDRTSDSRAYWSAVAAAVGAPEPDAAAVAALSDLDTAGWLGTDPGTLDLIAELHGAGVRLAVLSNAPASIGAAVRCLPWARAFEHYVISGEIGMVKPDLAIYHALLEQLDAPADRVLFTDDRPENVTGAQSVGIRAVAFTSADALRASLVSAGLPVRLPQREATRPEQRP